MISELPLFECGNLPRAATINGYDIHSLLTSGQAKIQLTLATAILLKRLPLSISGKMISLTSCLSIPALILLIAFGCMAP